MTWRRSTTELTFTSGGTYLDILSSIKGFFDSCAAEADFPWTVASSSLVAANGYVVLKRKNGNPGRIYIGTYDQALQNTANYLIQAQPSAGVTIGYDRTATIDTPIQGQNVGAPFGGTLTTNWMGARFLISTPTAQQYTLRAYTKVVEDILFFHMYRPNTSWSFYCVGNFVRNMHTNQYQLGQWFARERAYGSHHWMGLTDAENCGILHAQAVPLTDGSIAVGGVGEERAKANAYTWDSVNGLQAIFRTSFQQTMYAWTNNTVRLSSTAWVQEMSNMFVLADGTRFFVPLYCVGEPSRPATIYRFFRIAFMGFGEYRSTTSPELLDNTLTNRGWYIGYHQTQYSDYSGFNLLNVDFT